MPLNDIIPFLVQKKAQRDKIEATENRNKKLSESFLKLRSATTPEERDSINAKILALGGNIGIQNFRPQADYSKVFKTFNVDPAIQEAINVGAIDFETGMRYNKALVNNNKPLDLEGATEIYNVMPLDRQEILVSPAVMVAQARLARRFGKEFANKITGVKSEDKLDDIFARIDSGEVRSMGELDAADRSRVIEKFKSKANQNALFDKKADIPKLLSEGRKAIQGKAALLFTDFLITFDQVLASWKNDTLLDGPQKDYFDKYYDKISGEIDGDAIITEGRNRFELQEKLRKDLSLTDRERTTVEVWVNRISSMRSPEDTRDDIRREYEALIESGQVSFNKRLLKLILEGLEE